MLLKYNCKVLLKVSNGKGSTCNIITHIRNNYHTYDLYDFVECVDIKGLTPSQKRKVRETFSLHRLTSETQLRYQIIRLY